MEFWDDDSDEQEDSPPKSFKEFPFSLTMPQNSGGIPRRERISTSYFHQLLDEYPVNVIRKEDKKIKDVVKENVLPFLPAKLLSRYKTVSKEWDRWISCPLLAHQQSFSCNSFSGYFYEAAKLDWSSQPTLYFLPLDHSTNGVPRPSLDFLPESIKILSSCNGLLLCQGWEKYYVCNPATQNWKMLSPPKCYHGAEPAVVLAFDPSPHNIETYYHVICAFPMLDQPIIGFEIYSSESNSWRRSSVDCCELENVNLVSGGLYLNGVAYYETTSYEVLAFHVKDEIAAVIPLPVHIGGRGSLTQMQGELCYVTASNEYENVFLIDIYAGADMSLKRSLSVNIGVKRTFTQSCQVLPCLNSDTVVMHMGSFICFYRPREQKVEFMTLPGGVSGKRFLPYVNSLVMLHDLKE